MQTLVSGLDPDRLAALLSARFGLGLIAEPGARNPASGWRIRATDLAQPNGFVIQVIPNWRSIEANFVPDSFAAELIRNMGEASPDARSLFERVAEVYLRLGVRITLRVNDSAVPNLSIKDSIGLPAFSLPSSPWNRFELKARRMSEANIDGGDSILRDAGEEASACLALVIALLPVEEVGGETASLFEVGLPEGAKTRVEVNRYERSPLNRAACIAIHGSACKACGFDFGRIYGPIGEGYIEVHHLIPVSKMGGAYIVSPASDLIPLCANCHAIVHRQDPPLTLDAVKALLSV